MIHKSFLLLTTAIVCSLISQGTCLGDDGVCTEDWDTVRFTFSPQNVLANMQSNIDHEMKAPNTLPLSIDIDDYSLSPCVTRTDSGAKFYGYRAVNNAGSGDVIGLYDVKGIFSGIQVRFPHHEVLVPNNTFAYDRVPMFQNETVDGVKYFVLTAYFRDPEKICTWVDEGTVPVLGNLLFFQNGKTPKELLEAPLRRNDAIQAKFTDSKCFMAMGQHSYHDLDNTANTQCKEITPVFLLQNKCGYLVGFGFVWVGRSVSEYFEQPPAKIIGSIVGDKVPKCLLDLANKDKSGVGMSSMHVYLTKKTQFCDEDLTIEQVRDRFMGMVS